MDNSFALRFLHQIARRRMIVRLCQKLSHHFLFSSSSWSFAFLFHHEVHSTIVKEVKCELLLMWRVPANGGIFFSLSLTLMHHFRVEKWRERERASTSRLYFVSESATPRLKTERMKGKHFTHFILTYARLPHEREADRIRIDKRERCNSSSSTQ